nr:epoxide hydrolase [Tanacetum cinerariifolium]
MAAKNPAKVVKTLRFCDQPSASLQDHRSREEAVFPINISRSLIGVKLLGGSVSLDEEAQDQFEEALCASLEKIVTALGPEFGDWQWQLATLPIKLGGLRILSAGDIIQCAFLASRLQTSALQSKILLKTSIVSQDSSFKHALDAFNTTYNVDVFSVTTFTYAPHMMKTLVAYARVAMRIGWGDHAVHCSSEVGVKFRHNLVRDILVDVYFKVGIMVRKKALIGFISEDGKDLRPTDLLLFNWLQALHNAVEKKKKKHASICEENGYKFISFAVFTFGEFDTEALDTLSRIKSIFISHSNNAKSGVFIFHRGLLLLVQLILSFLSGSVVNVVVCRFVLVNGLKLHVAEIGLESSPAVIFLHGFPEIWYTWRHQMLAVAAAGFRVIAPDFRGYGLSESPAEPEKASFADLISDTASILDALAISKVFVIGKDFGAIIAYPLALLHPEKVAGIITLGLPFMPPGSFKHHFVLPEGFYPLRWAEPGRAEADFGRFDTKTVVKNIYILFSQSEMPIASENEEIMDLVKPSTPLPSWFTEKDLAEYAALYEKSGFRFALQVPYRSLDMVGSEVQDPKVEAKTLLIIGEKDYVLKIPGLDEYVRSGEVKKYVPNQETIYVPHGSHFVHEQFPDQINQLILTYLHNNKHLAAV